MTDLFAVHIWSKDGKDATRREMVHFDMIQFRLIGAQPIEFGSITGSVHLSSVLTKITTIDVSRACGRRELSETFTISPIPSSLHANRQVL
jgi:hypothetical protein